MSHHPEARRSKRPLAEAVVGLVGLTALVAFPGWASAHRPFDGTDAAVADEGSFELEMGPALAMSDQGPSELTLPGSSFNVGILDGWELSLDATQATTLGPPRGAGRALFVSEMHLKTLLRPGSLQHVYGPSIAAELGTFVPGEAERASTAGEIDLIVSEVFGPVIAHMNFQLGRDRTGTGSILVSLIVEGDEALALRPVAELTERGELGAAPSYSALGGAIWQIADGAALDAGLCAVVSDHATLDGELRVGLTWSTSLWTPHARPSLGASGLGP